MPCVSKPHLRATPTEPSPGTAPRPEVRPDDEQEGVPIPDFDFGDETPLDLENDDPGDLSVEYPLREPPSTADDDGEERLLDVLSDIIREPAISTEDDAVGLEHSDGALDLTYVPDSGAVADEEQEGPIESIVLRELPELDGAHGENADGASDSFLPDSMRDARDEAAPAPAAGRLQQPHFHIDTEPCSVLAVHGTSVVTGATDLLWFAGSDQAMRLSAATATMQALVLLGEQRTTAVFSTRTGELYRRSRLAAKAERLDGWRATLGRSPSTATTLDLWQSPNEQPTWLFARTAQGDLVFSADLGAHFGRCLAGLSVLAIAQGGWPFYALVRHDAALALVLTFDGNVFRTVSPEHPLPELQAGRIFLEGYGDVVALADDRDGLFLSSDGGHRFTRVPGTAAITALTLSGVTANDRVFAALYSVTEDKSTIISIDARTGVPRTIAVLGGTTPTDDSDVRHLVSRLAWAADEQRLFGAGAFGLVSFRVPEEPLEDHPAPHPQ